MEPSSFLTQRMAGRLQDWETKRPGRRQVSRRHAAIAPSPERSTQRPQTTPTDPIPSPRINTYIYTAAAILGMQTARLFGGVSTRPSSAPSPRRRPAAGQRGPAAPLEARRDAGRRLLCLRADDKSSNSCPPSRAHPAPRSGQGGGALPPNRPGRGTTREGGAARLPRCPQVALHPGPEEAADGRRRSPAARGAAPGGGAHLQPAGAPLPRHPPPGRRQPRAPRSSRPAAVGV